MSVNVNVNVNVNARPRRVTGHWCLPIIDAISRYFSWCVGRYTVVWVCKRRCVRRRMRSCMFCAHRRIVHTQTTVRTQRYARYAHTHPCTHHACCARAEVYRAHSDNRTHSKVCQVCTHSPQHTHSHIYLHIHMHRVRLTWLIVALATVFFFDTPTPSAPAPPDVIDESKAPSPLVAGADAAEVDAGRLRGRRRQWWWWWWW